MGKCPICGALNHTCGGVEAHSTNTYSRQVAFFKEGTKVEQPGVWVADSDYFLTEGGEVTTDRSQAVTLVVRAGQLLTVKDATAMGLIGERPERLMSPAAVKLAAPERGTMVNASGMPPKGQTAGVVPTGHPAFQQQAPEQQQAPKGEGEEGAEEEGEGGDLTPEEVEAAMEAERQSSAETKAVTPPRGGRHGKGPQVETTAVTPPKADGEEPKVETK